MNEQAPIRTRSWLFTPATRRERFVKAAEIGADVLLIDLEDAVAPRDKSAARTRALDYLAGPRAGTLRALRINGLDTRAGIADLDAQLESARGLAALEAISPATPRLAGLMFGAADMSADLGSATAWQPLAYARGRLIAVCALADILAIDSPFFELHDEDGLKQEVAAAVALGFSAKAAIHPAQIGPINAALAPSAEAVEKARAVIAVNAKGVGTVEGEMIDEAVARKARRTLAAAGIAA